jgi:hypothetical protein
MQYFLGFVAACFVPLIAKQSIAAVDAREGKPRYSYILVLIALLIVFLPVHFL